MDILSTIYLEALASELAALVGRRAAQAEVSGLAQVLLRSRLRHGM